LGGVFVSRSNGVAEHAPQAGPLNMVTLVHGMHTQEAFIRSDVIIL
jgi:hypothetical protein